LFLREPACVKSFADLSAREILAVAISSEEEDSRIYATFAEDLAERYPASAKVFEEMAEEERGHRHMLLDMYEQRFGAKLPPIRREDVKGFLRRRPIWLTKNLPLETIRKEAENMEFQAARFYERAAAQTTDVEIRKLLGDLAEIEKGHERHAGELEKALLTQDARAEEAKTSHRMFVLQYVQPGLAGLMDGSVSTLAPLFAAAFATHQNWQTFLVGLAASIGAGISMGFAEALSDDGALTGRGSPWLRGAICGLMTTLGGIGHTMPYLVPDAWPNAFWIATAIASVVVFVELWVIAWVRARYMDTPFLQAVFQVVLGGVIVLAAGILIGGA
jgi:rubrerythrin